MKQSHHKVPPRRLQCKQTMLAAVRHASLYGVVVASLAAANIAHAQKTTEQSVYILTPSSGLSLMLENSASSLTAPRAVSGLVAGDELVAIDVRPQTGRLYGLGQNVKTGSVQLYLLDYRGSSAVALPVGPAGSFVDAAGAPIPILARGLDIDFNPTVDRLRVVTTAGLNFRMNPNNGALIDGDLGGTAGSVPGLNPDASHNGAATGVMATAYTNNQVNATVTTQYALDEASNRLLIQQPPNAGTLVNPLPISVGSNALDFTALGGLDIMSGVDVSSSGSAAAGEAIAALNSAGSSRLYRINLSNGNATPRADLGATSVVDIALAQTRPAAFALTGSGTQLVRFPLDLQSPSAIANISGVLGTERLVGIDLRPANGVLYALGIDADGDRGTLYRLEPQSAGGTAMAAAIGASGQIRFVDESGLSVDLSTISHGIDFNPVADRMRVVDASGLNFRIDPNTGAPVDGNSTAAGVNPDGMIAAPLGTQLGATAYTNSIAGTVATTQYTLDQANGMLSIQNPPNAGTQTMRTPIRMGAMDFVFGGGVGFDIPAGVAVTTSNAPVVAGAGFFTSSPSAGMPRLYRLDLATASASNLGAIAAGGQELEGLVVTQAPFELALATDSITVMEQAAPARINIQRLAGGDGLVRYSTANGTALAGSDYVATSGVLAFGSADNSAGFDLQVLLDSEDEVPETLLFNLVLPSGRTQTLTVFIVNDRLFSNGFE